MRYQLAIFDMDGTILNTLQDLTNSLNAALQLSGYPQHTLEEVRFFVGNGIRKLIERGVPAGTPVAQIDKVHQDFTEHYRVHCADTTQPYAGIPELLQQLRNAGCKTAVVSNKADYAVQELCKQYFDGMFDFAVGERKNMLRTLSTRCCSSCRLTARRRFISAIRMWMSKPPRMPRWTGFL